MSKLTIINGFGINLAIMPRLFSECFFRSVTSMPKWKIEVNLCEPVQWAARL